MRSSPTRAAANSSSGELWKNTGSGLADAGQIYAVTLPTDNETRSSSNVQLLLGDYDSGDGFADIALRTLPPALRSSTGNGASHFTPFRSSHQQSFWWRHECG